MTITVPANTAGSQWAIDIGKGYVVRNTYITYATAMRLIQARSTVSVPLMIEI